MPSKRTYNVRVAKDFLVLAGVFFFLCLWAVKDAWYPSDKVLKKHPRTIEASFETAGTVGRLHVGVDTDIGEGQVLAELRQVKMQVSLDAAKKTYTATKDKLALRQKDLHTAKSDGTPADKIVEIEASLTQTQETMDTALKQIEDLRTAMAAAVLHSPSKGKILEVLTATHSQVEAGEAVMVIDPKDHFYLFNQSLAIFSFIAFWVFLALHLLGT